MNSDTFSLLKLDRPASSEASRLFRLSPKGIGTPLPEANSNYLARLSQAHSILLSTLLAFEILPAMGLHNLSVSLQRGGSRIFSRPTLFNGMNTFAEKLIVALQLLTQNSDLKYLTLLPLKELIDCKGAFRTHRAWCMECLHAYRAQKTTAYEALPWALNLLKVCPAHHIPLSTNCPHCGSALPVVTRQMQPGHCSHCGKWLFKGSAVTPKAAKLSDFERWTVDNLSSLFTEIPDLTSILSASAFATEVRKHIESRYSGNASAFARESALPKATVTRWRTGTYRPSMQNLVAISFVTGTPLVELITQGLAGRTPDSMRKCETLSIFSPSCRFKSLNLKKTKRALRHILRNQSVPPPTMTEVAKRLGHTKTTLYKHFPVLCRAISAKASKNIAHRKKNRLEQQNLFVEKIAEQLCLDGFYPSYDAVEKASGKKSFLRNCETHTAWLNATNSLGFSVSDVPHTSLSIPKEGKHDDR